MKMNKQWILPSRNFQPSGDDRYVTSVTWPLWWGWVWKSATPSRPSRVLWHHVPVGGFHCFWFSSTVLCPHWTVHARGSPEASSSGQRHQDDYTHRRMATNSHSTQKSPSEEKRKWSNLYERSRFLSSLLGLSLFSHLRVIILKLVKYTEAFGGSF